MSNKYYITTTLPYVNAEPHIGFALEIVQADVLARYQRLLGNEVVFNTGTDEHGLKIYRKAVEQDVEPQAYCDEYAAKFDSLRQSLNLSYTNFIRTTDPHHVAAAQEFWKLCAAKGDIYKKKYQVKYCVGCELEKTDSELADGKCPVHPNLEIELIDEENYFFKFSKYQTALLDLYDKNSELVIPANRLKEIHNFVASGLQDFSISRLKSKMPWGVPVPGDDEQVMYVWFDALVNYISTIGWPTDLGQYNTLWPGIQVAGKDNLRQQTAMWQAMLMSAGLPTAKQIFIHGFVTVNGQKISKSLGNTVDFLELINKYGTDAVRFFLLGGLSSYEDGDYTQERFDAYYTAHLANGIGNLTSRILTMLEKYQTLKPVEDVFGVEDFWNKYAIALEIFSFDALVELINALVSECDELISKEKPWEKAKNGEDISGLLYQLAEALRHIGLALLPVMPTTAEKILNSLGIDIKNLNKLTDEKKWGKLKSDVKVNKGEILFPRLS